LALGLSTLSSLWSVSIRTRPGIQWRTNKPNQDCNRQTSSASGREPREYFVSSLRGSPELAIFLALALGFLIGRIRIGSFSLGNVVGTLLAGVLIGQPSGDVS
jgi:hypothetical protein